MGNIIKFSVFENESGATLWSVLEDNYTDITVVHTLIDEGYLDKNGELKNNATYEDCADYCEKEMGQEIIADDIKSTIESVKKLLLK